jgi:putative FmdB family regulatory protein
MPMYDFACSKCGHVFELNRRISERDETADLGCPSCSEYGSITRQVASPLVGYSVSVNGGYGSRVPDGFKEVLKRIDQRAPGSRMKETSSFL